MRLSNLLMAVLLLSCWACFKPSYTVDQMPADRLEFGEGESGEHTTVYALLPTGQLYQRNIEKDSFIQLKVLPRDEVKDVFRKRDSIRLLSYDYFFPSDNYQFLTQMDVMTEHTISWGANYNQAPEEIASFYRLLISHVTGKEEKKESQQGKKEESKGFGW